MAISAVGQEYSTFFTERGADPSKSGSFLSYNPVTGQYEEATYKEVSARQEQEVLKEKPVPKTVKDFFESGTTSGGRPSSRREVLSRAPAAGDVHRAAVGFETALTVRDVISTASMANPLSLAFTGYETYTGFTEGMTRAETFEQAEAAGATVADMLAASAQAPSWTDYAKNVAALGLSAFTGNVAGLASGGLSLMSNVSAQRQAEAALERAGEREREVAATGGTTFGGFGYINTAANFAAQQAQNLAAASTETRTPSVTTIRDVMSGAARSTSFAESTKGGFDTISAYRERGTGDIISRTDFSGGGSFSQNISENRRTAERREREGYTGSTSSDRRGTSGFGGGATGSASESFGGREAGFGSSLGGGTGTVGGDSGWGR